MLIALLKLLFYGALIVASCMLVTVLARSLFYVVCASNFSLVFALRTRTEPKISFGKRFMAGLRRYAQAHPLPELLNLMIGSQ